jgi:hypothetical protein
MTYGAGTFVGLGAYSNAVYCTSLSGNSWSTATMASSLSWTGITYGNGYFLAVANGSSTTNYSTNGTTWTAGSISSSTSWSAVASAPNIGTFAAVASGYSSLTNSASYLNQSAVYNMPAAFGIYNGPLTTH